MLVKELTLDQIWEECLKMWKWIVENPEAKKCIWVWAAKDAWLIENGYVPSEVENTCFFCSYSSSIDNCWNDDDEDEGSWLNCPSCPAKLVDKTFSCHASEYDYLSKPVEFYQKLLELDEIRRSKNG